MGPGGPLRWGSSTEEGAALYGLGKEPVVAEGVLCGPFEAAPTAEAAPIPAAPAPTPAKLDSGAGFAAKLLGPFVLNGSGSSIVIF